MHQHLGIRENLRLVSSDRNSLSAESLDTAETRKSEFLGFLAHLWSYEGRIVIENESLLQKLKRTSVICVNGKYGQLWDSYLPLKPLLDLHSRFLDDEDFPFLEIAELHGEVDVPAHWSFLTSHLSVGKQDTVSFRLQLMRCIKDANLDAGSLVNPSRVIDLYQSIDARTRLSRDPDWARERIRWALIHVRHEKCCINSIYLLGVLGTHSLMISSLFRRGIHTLQNGQTPMVACGMHPAVLPALFHSRKLILHRSRAQAPSCSIWSSFSVKLWLSIISSGLT
jgi:hypothetical protein